MSTQSLATGYIDPEWKAIVEPYNLLRHLHWGIHMNARRAIDIEKSYPIEDFIAKIRRLADCLENGERFEIQIAGERIYVPVHASYSIEHEREGGMEEIEFQIKWPNELA